MYLRPDTPVIKIWFLTLEVLAAYYMSSVPVKSTVCRRKNQVNKDNFGCKNRRGNGEIVQQGIYLLHS